MLRTSDRRTDSTPELLERPLLWWRVPERPGVGAAMVRNAITWLVSVMVLLVIVELLT